MKPREELPRYQVIDRCFLWPARCAGPRQCEAGEVIEFSGVPGPSLMPLNAAARAAKAAAVRPEHLRAPPGFHADLVRWARSCGAPEGLSIEEARDFLLAFVADGAPR